MKGRAALLLVTFAFATVQAGTTTHASPTTEFREKLEEHLAKIATTEITGKTSPSTVRPGNAKKEQVAAEFGQLFANPKDILLQEIRSLDEDASTDKQIQEELAKAIKAEAQKTRPRVSTTAKPRVKITVVPNTIDDDDTKTHGELDEDRALKALKQAETELPFDDETNEDSDEDGDDEDADDEYDDEDDDEDEDDISDEEEIMTECPDYCRCSGQYAAATTAKCSKLIEKQNFGPGIARLMIENAGEINLGPHALRARGLQQLESVTIVDTRIAALDRTAFDGIDYLFAVNLTRTALIEVDPDYFQNNTQLSLLTISGQPLGPAGSKFSTDYVLDAPSVTELDFSNNGITHLPRAAFSKMPNLAYVNLKNNRLRNVQKSILEPMDSLVELDLSGNLLVEIPAGALDGKGLETLRIASNNLTSLNLQQASKLESLDASNNRIKFITKDDLAGAPSLQKLYLSSNGIKRIHQHSFSILDQLTHLDISDNNIANLTEHHLRSNPRLQVLVMNNNPGIRVLPVFKTIGYEYETYSVFQLECANCGLETIIDGTFDAMPALTRLNLARNNLTRLPVGLFRPLSSLRELDLSDNLIKALEPKMFVGARSLSRLSLAGNPLVTLQVTPFLQSPGLARLDVSRCMLRRIWSEARQPLKSLRFLSVRSNDLQRITVEELKAMPKLSGLDATQNPFACDEEFNQAIQWLIEHGVTPTEVLRYMSSKVNAEEYAEAEGVGKWTDLARVVCDDDEDGPPPRTIPQKPVHNFKMEEQPKEEDSIIPMTGDNGIPDLELIHGMKNHRMNDIFEEAWSEQYQDYDELKTFSPESEADFSSESRPWYSGAVWPAMTVGLVVLALLLLIAQLGSMLSKRKGRGPVIRPPMMLRQGLVDNKNCGLVYKPLQEEIATPHMPKRGSFYSSSTFHYDKIVPESV